MTTTHGLHHTFKEQALDADASQQLYPKLLPAFS